LWVDKRRIAECSAAGSEDVYSMPLSKAVAKTWSDLLSHLEVRRPKK
jgi:hypothetical protein